MPTLSRDEALDFATDHFIAGNLNKNVPSTASNSEIELLLSPWGVTVTEEGRPHG